MMELVKPAIKDHAEADFELVWKKMVHMSFPSLKEAHRHSYLAGRGAQKFQDEGSRLLSMAGKLDSCGAETQKENL